MTLLSRYRTALIVLCGIVALYALLGFVVAPYAVKTYAIPAWPNVFGTLSCSVTSGSIHLPFR